MFFTRILGLACALCFSCLHTLSAQENLTAYLQPQIALNYKVLEGYSHNFSVAQRNYMYDDSELQLKTRHLDLAHFSKLKIRDNQSFAAGIKFRFRENFETDKNNELRLTQQYNITSKPRIARFGHRIRSEQRITKVLTTHRFRYRFAVDFPLDGEQLDVGEGYLIVTTESLLSVARSQGPEYDQRITANIGWLLEEKTKVQLGLEYRAEAYNQKTENIFFFNTNLIFSL